MPEEILRARREIEVARTALEWENEFFASRPSVLPPGVATSAVTGASAAPVSTVGNAAQAAGMPFPERVSQGVAPDHAARGQPGQADVPTGSDPWSMQDPWGRCSSQVGQGTYFAGLPTPAMAPALTMGPQGAMYCPIGTPPGSPQRDSRARFDTRKPVFDANIARDSKYQYDRNKQEGWNKKTTKNYLVGCAFEMELLLDEAEGFRKLPLTPNDVVALATWSDSAMMNYDVHRLDRELWSFPNLNLTGKVKETFDTLPWLHGLEAWRRVVAPWP